MYETFEAALVEQCAPTLAGVKPANLFRFSGIGARASAEAWDGLLRPLGVCVQVLKECGDACMIYVYRPQWVERLLQESANRRFLEEMGYVSGDAASMLTQLSDRLCLEREYPHEIGVFLGYPLRDVIGFIENRGWNYTCCGFWKSYSDPEEAEQCFERYRVCTARCTRLFYQGTPVTQLVAA